MELSSYPLSVKQNMPVKTMLQWDPIRYVWMIRINELIKKYEKLHIMFETLHNVQVRSISNT